MRFLFILFFLFCVTPCIANPLPPIEILKKVEHKPALIEDFNAQVVSFHLSYSKDLCLEFLSDQINKEEIKILKYLRSNPPLGGVKEIDIRKLSPSGLEFAYGFPNIENIVINKFSHTPIFRKYPNVKHFSIKNSEMSHDEMKQLFTSMDTNKLFHFSCDSSFGDEELEVCAPYFQSLNELCLIATPITDKGLETLAPYVKNLSLLNISLCFDISENGLAILGKNLANIKSLHFSFCPVTDKVLESLSPNVKKLKHCGLIFPYLDQEDINKLSGKGLAKFLSNLHSIKSLNLDTFGLTNLALEALTQNAKDLESLQLSSTNGITEATLEKLFSNLHKIKKLELEDIVTDQVLETLASNAGNLEHLNLRYSQSIWNLFSDKGLQALATNLVNIRHLELKGPVTDNALNALSSNLRNLDYLQLDRGSFSNIGLEAIAPNLKNLQVLKLRRCSHISGEGLAYFSPYLLNLQTLEVDELKKANKGLKHLNSVLEHIHILSFSKTDVNNSTLAEIAPSLLHLKSLNCSGCPKVSGDGLEALTAHLPKNPNLEFKFANKNLSNSNILQIAPFLGGLHHVELDLCCKFSNAGLVTIAPYLNNVRSLSLVGCEKITNTGIEEALPLLESLVRINLKKTKVTESAKLMLISHGIQVD